jgi:hypothetical protein
MHCTIVISAPFMHSLEHVYAEPESEVKMEQDLEYGGPPASNCDESNIHFFLSKISPSASHQLSLPFFLSLSYGKFNCALGL